MVTSLIGEPDRSH